MSFAETGWNKIIWFYYKIEFIKDISIDPLLKEHMINTYYYATVKI